MASFDMQACLWLLALCSILRCDKVESTVFTGDGYFSFESDSTFHNIHDSYTCYLHYDPNDSNFCSEPPLNVTLHEGSGCIAVLFSRGDCNLSTQVMHGSAWLDDQMVKKNVSDYPMEGILLISGFVADENYIRPARSEDYETDWEVVTVTYDAGQTLQSFALHWDYPFVHIDRYPPYNEDPYEEERLDVLPIVFMAGALVVAMLLCLYYIRKCNTEEDMCIFRGNPSAVPRVPGAAPAEEPKKVLTESQVNELLNTHLDKKTENDTEGEVDDETDGDDANVNKADFGVSKDFSTRPCAICIEDCDSEAATGSLIMTLPCKHQFHADCIVPWLTQRKAQCPLCNDDLSKRVRRQPSTQARRSIPAATSSGTRPSSATAASQGPASGPTNTFSLNHITW